MFQFLYIMGPAAITYLTVRKCIKEEAPNWYTALAELIAYAMINAAILCLFLLPSGKVEIILMTNGVKNIQYGGTAFLLSIPVAVVSGIFVSAIRNGIDMNVKVFSSKKDKKNEK